MPGGPSLLWRVSPFIHRRFGAARIRCVGTVDDFEAVDRFVDGTRMLEPQFEMGPRRLNGDSTVIAYIRRQGMISKLGSIDTSSGELDIESMLSLVGNVD